MMLSCLVINGCEELRRVGGKGGKGWRKEMVVEREIKREKNNKRNAKLKNIEKKYKEWKTN